MDVHGKVYNVPRVRKHEITGVSHHSDRKGTEGQQISFPPKGGKLLARVQLGSIEQIGHMGCPKLQFVKTGSIQLNRGVGQWAVWILTRISQQ